MQDYELLEKKKLLESIDIDLDRIYFEMNSLLLETPYMESFGEEKKNIFKDTFRLYLLGKIRKVGIFSFNEKSEVLEMIKFIADRQDDEGLYVLVHYLLSIISSFQGWEVVWELNNDFDVDEREIQVHTGILNKFETGKRCDVYKSFAILYYFFTDSLVLEDDVKRLEFR